MPFSIAALPHNEAYNDQLNYMFAAESEVICFIPLEIFSHFKFKNWAGKMFEKHINVFQMNLCKMQPQ